MINKILEFKMLYRALVEIECGDSIINVSNKYSIEMSALENFIGRFGSLNRFKGSVLYDFFSRIEEYFTKRGLQCVNKMLSCIHSNAVYSKDICQRWYDRKDRSFPQMFGSYFYFGSDDFLLHIEVGTYNLHIGIVRGFKTNENYFVVKMSNRDFDVISERLEAALPQGFILNKREWGPVWASVDLGNVYKDIEKLLSLDVLCAENMTEVQNKINLFINALQTSRFLNDKYNKIQYNPSKINFRVSYKCNIQCRHCYNESNGKEQESIDVNAAIKTVREAYTIGIKSLGITGGEAMLFMKKIIPIIREAIRIGFDEINITTNGYWGRTYAGAVAIIGKLKCAGFAPPVGNLGISAGEFHREFLDWQYHGNIIRANHEIFGTRLRVDFEYSDGNSTLVDSFKDYMKSLGVQKSWYNLVVRTSIAHVGRWKENAGDVKFYKKVESIGQCRPSTFLTVEPNGDVFPCCGFNRKIIGLKIGNIYDSSVAEIVARANDTESLKMLFRLSFAQIHLIKSKGKVLPDSYGSQCEACLYFFGG